MVVDRSNIEGFLAICAGENPDELDLGYGLYFTPAGTINASGVKTKEDSATEADKVPIVAGMEMIKGRILMGLSPEEDVQEKSSVLDRYVARGYGRFSGVGQLTVPAQVGTARFEEMGKGWNPANQSYEPAPRPLLYHMIIAERPDYKHLNASTAKHVFVFLRTTTGNSQPMIESPGNKRQIDFNYERVLHFIEYTFNGDLLPVQAGATVDDEFNPTNQVKVPTRAHVNAANVTGSGNVHIKGLNYREEYVEELVAVSGNGDFYSTNLFTRIYDDSDGDPEKGIKVGTGLTAIDLTVKAAELYHKNT